MNKLSTLVLVVFILVALFGAYAALTHDSHTDGCPLMVSGEVICGNTILDHLSLWQTMFAGTLAAFSFVLLRMFALLRDAPVPDASPYVSVCMFCAHATDRPTLLQELFSRGLLNPKSP